MLYHLERHRPFSIPLQYKISEFADLSQVRSMLLQSMDNGTLALYSLNNLKALLIE